MPHRAHSPTGQPFGFLHISCYSLTAEDLFLLMMSASGGASLTCSRQDSFNFDCRSFVLKFPLVTLSMSFSVFFFFHYISNEFMIILEKIRKIQIKIKSS